LTIFAGLSISTHVLDTSLGHPASEIAVALERQEGRQWIMIGGSVTDEDGRVRSVVPQGASVSAGTYRLVFETGAYFARRGVATFYPQVTVIFEAREAQGHYHVPLLLSPYGYSTYRGS
jgi:5-hydroxyisourate hydrolase